jgi:hypothetical protein
MENKLNIINGIDKKGLSFNYAMKHTNDGFSKSERSMVRST